MTSRHDQLWGLISNHPMPADAAGLPFTDQLMQDHGIRRDTALTAIAEYRKFMYLCATREARNVPSKAVDLVWHLHMQHSRDYWDVFCRKLGKPIHHSPGGAGRAHLDDYKATVAAYRDLFGQPPKGVWRLRNRLNFVLGLLISTVFVVFGLSMMTVPEVPVVFALVFTGIGLFAFFNAAYGLTSQGEFTLVFEVGDPFADKDAGDCGSGDGGGCGD